MTMRIFGISWGAAALRRRTSPGSWRMPIRWNNAARKLGRKRVFCGSLCDVFDHQAEQAWRYELYSLIEATPHLDWLLLTKRTLFMPTMLPTRWLDNGGRFPRNVWLGFSAGNQAMFDARWEPIERTAREGEARTLFVSLEPLIGPVDISRACGYARPPDWIIVGGESGPDARPCRPEWIREIVRQASDHGVRVFVKQLGGAAGMRDPKGGDPAEWPADLRVREFPG